MTLVELLLIVFVVIPALGFVLSLVLAALALIASTVTGAIAEVRARKDEED